MIPVPDATQDAVTNVFMFTNCRPKFAGPCSTNSHGC